MEKKCEEIKLNPPSSSTLTSIKYYKYGCKISEKTQRSQTSLGCSEYEDEEYEHPKSKVKNIKINQKTRQRKRIHTEEQRQKKIAADHIYRASLTDEQREKIRAKHRERSKTLTKEQRERRLASQRKYRASLTEEQLLRRKIRNRERLRSRDNIELVNGKIKEVETIKKWTSLPIEQRNKRNDCPRTYGSRLTKEEREIKRLEMLEQNKVLITNQIKSEPCDIPVHCNNLCCELVKTVKIEKNDDCFENQSDWVSVKEECQNNNSGCVESNSS